MAEVGDTPSRVFDLAIMTLIILNIFAVILETVKSIESEYSFWLRSFELFSVIIFSAEYIMRLWLCTVDFRYKSAVKGRLKYMLSPMALIDLLAILPFYIPMIITLDLRFLRALRLMRLMRLLKIGRYSESLKKFGVVLRLKKEELGITVFIVALLLILTSSIMYYIEHEAQPDAISSIPMAMWSAVATLTTVGYGDVYPVTVLGKLLGAVIAVLGVGMVALPAGIIASGFTEQIHIEKKKTIVCPHCGKSIENNSNSID